MGRIVNLSFAHLTDADVEMLDRIGLTRGSQPVERQTHLPMMMRRDSPEETRSKVRGTVARLRLSKSSYVSEDDASSPCQFYHHRIPVLGNHVVQIHRDSLAHYSTVGRPAGLVE